MCNTNNCPAGIATQKPELRKRLDIDHSAQRLKNFLESSTELMKVMARACGHNALGEFNSGDLATWNRELSYLSGIEYAGMQR